LIQAFKNVNSYIRTYENLMNNQQSVHHLATTQFLYVFPSMQQKIVNALFITVFLIEFKILARDALLYTKHAGIILMLLPPNYY